MNVDPLLIAVIIASAFAAGTGWYRARLTRRKLALLEHDLATEKKETDEIGNALTIAQGQLGDALALVPAASTAVEIWQRKYWEMNDLVASCLEQRDVWKDMWFTQSAEHLEGQAVLENKIVQMRQNLIRGIVTCNRLLKDRAEAKGEPFKAIARPADLDPLDSAPVGQAAAYRDRMIALLKAAPKAFDALAHRDAISLGLGAKGVFRCRPLTVRAERIAEPRDVETPVGRLRAHAGNWVVRDLHGKPVVVEHDVFKRSYQEVPPKNIETEGLKEGEEVFVQVLSGPELGPAPA